MTFILEAVGLTQGGGRELALNLISHLPRFREHRFVLFVRRLPEYRALSGPNLRFIFYEGGARLLSRYAALQRTVPGICKQHGAAALLCLGNFAPRRSPCPAAVLIQNACLVTREPVAERRRTLRERLIAAWGKRSLRRLPPGVRVIVQTMEMGDRVVSALSLDPERISIIPCPSAHVRNYPPLRIRDAANGGDTPFTFLCLARYYAHKNLETLPETMKLLAGRSRVPVRCLITISASQHPGARKLLRRIQEEGLEGLVTNIGPVARERLAELYGAADALIAPSLLESYSGVYSEAMHFGVPVLTSDREFARELCGDAALYFDPLDPENIAKTMLAVMEDHSLRQALVGRGHRIVAQLSQWEDVAERFVRLLERIAEGQHMKTPHPFSCAGALSPTGEG